MESAIIRAVADGGSLSADRRAYVAILANAAFWSYLGYRRNVPAIADLQRDFDS